MRCAAHLQIYALAATGRHASFARILVRFPCVCGRRSDERARVVGNDLFRVFVSDVHVSCGRLSYSGRPIPVASTYGL